LWWDFRKWWVQPGLRGVRIREFMANESDTLFDMSEYVGGEKVRKAPENEAEKRLRDIREMEDRDFRNLQRKLNGGKTLTDAEAKRLEGYKYGYEAEAGNNLPDNMVRTAKDVGKYVGKSLRTIRNWIKRGMPTKFEGYDLADIEAWALREGLLKQAIIKNDESRGNGTRDYGDKSETGDVGTGEIEPRDRAYYEKQIKKLDAALKTIKLQKERGELVPREDIAREWTARAKEYANTLDYMETRFPPLLEGKARDDMRVIIHRECRRIKDNLFRMGTFCPTPEEAI